VIRRGLAIAVLAGVVLAGAMPWGGGNFATSASLGSGVIVPELSEAGLRGQTAFGKYCATCHGADAGGTGSGPPLIHKLYHPGHHGDMAFAQAARRGSQAHHWGFGDMPPVAGVSDADLADIIAFIRETQKANGIF
jgi:mono/diheme cytochrome c family protein